MADVAKENKGVATTATSLDMIATTLQNLTYEMKRLTSLPEKLEAIEKKMERDNPDICLSLKMAEEQRR